MSRVVPLLALTACAAGPDPARAPSRADAAAAADAGAFRSAPVLSVAPLHWGRTVDVVVSGAAVGETVGLWASRAGTGPGPCPAPLGGLCLDLVAPSFVGAAVADAAGVAVVP